MENPNGGLSVRARAAITCVLMLVTVALGGATVPASAHSRLVSSTPADGAVLTAPPTTITLTFNETVTSPTLNASDDVGNPVTVTAPAAYLRVAVVLGDGGTSSLCVAPATAPSGFPVRDDDGVVANHRSFIYANGYGWAWNEAVPGGAIHGDWGIRLGVIPLPHDDTGVIDAGARDAGAIDAGAMDGGAADGSTNDAGAPTPSARGCGCSTTAPRGPSLGALLFGLAMLAARYGSKTTRPKRSGTWKSPTSGSSCTSSARSVVESREPPTASSDAGNCAAVYTANARMRRSPLTTPNRTLLSAKQNRPGAAHSMPAATSGLSSRRPIAGASRTKAPRLMNCRRWNSV